MKRLEGLKIKNRLILNSAAIIIFSSISILLAVFFIGKLNNGIDSLQNKALPVNSATENIRRNIIIIERNMLDMVLTDDLELVNDLLYKNIESTHEIDESFETFSDIVSDSYSKKVEELRMDIMKLREIQHSIENVLEQSNGEEWKEAEKILRESYIPSSIELREDFIEISNMINNILQTSISRIQKLSIGAQYLIFLLTILCIIFSIVLVRKLIKDIMNPLSEIEAATKALS